MSNGALPKTKCAKSSLNREHPDNIKVQNSSSEFSFELRPKPKLTCIPENCSKMFNDLRKSQSMSVAKNSEAPEKSCSVLFIGSKSNVQTNSLIL